MKLLKKLLMTAVMLMSSASFAQDDISSADEVAQMLLPEAASYDADHSLNWRFGPLRPPRRPNPPPYRPEPPRRPRPLPPPPPHRPPPGYGNLICTATDRGWEEHSRGHGSCGECLRVHGECIETCEATVERHTCQYVGYDRAGRAYSFAGVGRDRWEAERNAQDSCYRSGYHSCQYNGCTASWDRQEVSRRNCR